jgi:hypothetical protein
MGCDDAVCASRIRQNFRAPAHHRRSEGGSYQPLLVGFRCARDRSRFVDVVGNSVRVGEAAE